MDRDSERDGDKDTDRLNVKNDANLDYRYLHIGSIYEKNKGKKSCATVPFRYTG